MKRLLVLLMFVIMIAGCEEYKPRQYWLEGVITDTFNAQNIRNTHTYTIIKFEDGRAVAFDFNVTSPPLIKGKPVRVYYDWDSNSAYRILRSEEIDLNKVEQKPDK